MKEHIFVNPADWPDDFIANFELLLKGEMTGHRIEPNTMSSELQRRVFELQGVHL